MTIKAEIVADSVSPQGIRLTTMRLRYPKFIHGEAKAHRAARIADRAYETLEEVGFMDDRNLSRNASSSRAIPVERMIQDVIDDPAMPVFWGVNRKGMQATDEASESERPRLKSIWLRARDDAVVRARQLHDAGLHKQIVNRVIEPWCHINVVVTATDWANFFALRCHEDAQPEMRALAEAMRDAMAASVPTSLWPGEWHLPFVDEADRSSARSHRDAYVAGNTDARGELSIASTLVRVSVARCARVSYLTQDGRAPSVEEDLALYDRLVGSTPLHASPAEHQATPDVRISDGFHTDMWSREDQHGNLRGWRQYRKTLPNECAPEAPTS